MSAPLLNAESICKSFGSRQLFKNISLSLFSGEKIGLIGPNGAGKSTFMKILAGIEPQDEGLISFQAHLKTAYVAQETQYPDLSLREYLMQALEKETYLEDYEKETQIAIYLSKLEFENFEAKISTLSGGWKKRLDLAYALINAPDLIFLDEPTNHLDIESILWLEKFIKASNFTCLITSHDRSFLENITSRMIELNPCYPQGFFSIKGPYSHFLEKREEFLTGQVQYQKSLASKVRREIDWLKQTPKARTTKSRSRIQEAHQLIEKLSEVKTRNTSSKAQIDFFATGRETKKLITVNNISKSLGGKTLFSKLSFILNPGMRLAIVGGNGTGKSTLMKILIDELQADTGNIKKAEGLKIVYFDQAREKLDPTLSVKEALSPNGEMVNFQGRSIHVNSYGKRFLFTPERMQLPIKMLSGGERARIIIARLMTQVADVLLLDEPTNDLDITTLEILEESLKEFKGAIVFITHDRYMLNDLATLYLGLGFNDNNYFFSDYYQWEEHLLELTKKIYKKSKNLAETPPITQQKKLSYKEKMELTNMEETIHEAEHLLENLQKKLENTSPEKIQELCKKIKNTQEKIDSLYIRWEKLEDRS